MLLLSLFLQILTCAFLILSSHLLWVYFRSPIKNIPGPFLAKFTNLWRFLDTYGGRAELTQRILHEKYGDAVRLGPNLVSISDPKLLRVLYNTRGDFLKGESYSVNDTKVGGQILQNVFSTRSNEIHAAFLRPIQKFYKLSNVLTYEPVIDDVIAAFCKHIDERFVSTKKTCKIDEWLLFFAWDVIAQITLGRSMGFMDEGKDHSGMINTAEKGLDYFALIIQVPSFDQWLAKNPIRPMGPPSFEWATTFCAQEIMKRQQEGDEGLSRTDMLAGFLGIKGSGPEKMTNDIIIGTLLVNILAGADTTAILLRTIVYYTLRNPKVYKKVQLELDEAALAQPITFAAADALPYLDAVIRESMRFHPSIGLVLERIVPENGLTLSNGTIIPRGTIVGMNSWVINQNKQIYGEDAASFKPERWLRDIEAGETEKAFEARLLLMKATDLSFGAGSRVCLGKNISLVETYKLVATLFSTYDLNFVDANKEWHVQNSWFVRQSDIDIKIRRRNIDKTSYWAETPTPLAHVVADTCRNFDYATNLTSITIFGLVAISMSSVIVHVLGNIIPLIRLGRKVHTLVFDTMESKPDEEKKNY